MNAIDFLITHHRELEAQFKELADSKTIDRKTFNKMADALAAHMTVEEEIFYPAVKAKTTEDILLESLEEHLSLKRVLADLVQMRSNGEKFEPKLHVLSEQAEHHHEEEEENLFPKVKKLLDKRELETLGVRMEARISELIEHAVRNQVGEETNESASLK